MCLLGYYLSTPVSFVFPRAAVAGRMCSICKLKCTGRIYSALKSGIINQRHVKGKYNSGVILSTHNINFKEKYPRFIINYSFINKFSNVCKR